MRIAGLDPGKQRDSFAFVGTEIREKKIYVKGARRWLGRDYIDVERHIGMTVHQNTPFDYYVVERNSMGEHVVEVLKRQYKLPVLPVTTQREIKDKKKIYSPRIMGKNEMVLYMLILIQEGRLVFTKTKNDEIRELERQMSIFAEHKTEAGQYSYRAEGDEHDDLVMALMLACFIGRFYINRRAEKKTYGVASKKFIERSEDVLGSGVPEEYTVKGRAVWNP